MAVGHLDNESDDSARLDGRRGSVVDRRSQFLRASAVGIEELRERKERRKAAIAAVKAALEAESGKDKLCRPLRRFGCALTVVLFYHKRSKGVRRLSSDSVQRRTVVMKDKAKWSKLVEAGGFFETELRLGKGAAKGLVYQYFNRRGRGVRITKQGEWDKALDDMWDKQPPELHVYDSDAQPRAAEDRAGLLSSIFNEYDANGDGQLSMREVKEMILNLQLTDRIGVSKEDMAVFVAADFHRADADRNNLMSYHEFSSYFDSLQDLLQDTLTRENKFEHTFAKFKESFVQAHSERVPLGELVRGERRGLLRLDTRGHDYGIEVRFAEECLCEENEGLWARAQTLLESSVDYFEDETGNLGELFSPVVWVEVEEQAELDDDFSVRFPHAFAEEGLSKSDVLVAYADFDGGVWQQVDEAAFRFLPGNDQTGMPPSISVRMVEGGIVAAFGRSDKKLKQRMRMVAYVPDKIIPLEMEQLNVYLLPALPDQEKLLDFLEIRERGSKKQGGKSDVLTVRQSAMVEVALKQGGGKTEAHSLQWSGELASLSFELDPDVFQEERGESGPASAHELRREFALEVAVTDLQARRLSIVNRHSMSNGRQVSRVPCSLSVHAFPSPSPPRELAVTLRTNTLLQLCWLHPTFWGGCALSHYEVQLRERTNKGVIKEWRTVGDASERNRNFKPTADLPFNVFAGELRVRAYNCASLTPSDWSAVCVVLSEKEEKAATRVQALSRGHLSRSRRRFSIDGAMDEAGIAAVVQNEIGDAPKMRRSLAMPGWSGFARAVGEFYLAAGVRGGVEGKLFDLTPLEVEELSKANSTAGEGSEDYPLLGLCACGVWVLETLAHHTSNPPEWVCFMNEVAGLVNLAATQKAAPNDAVVSGHHRAILYALMAVYETLRQSEPNGYLTRQLEYRYDKKLRKLLRADWEATLADLKNDVSTHVMELTLYLSAQQPSSNRPALKRLVSSREAHPLQPTAEAA